MYKTQRRTPKTSSHTASDGCQKRGYPSKKSARQANRTNGANLRVYLCSVCRAYHVTREHIRDL